MVRPVAAVILGYLGMAVWVMMSVGIAWKLLGEDFAVNPDTMQATGRWIALNIPLGFVGAMLGGWLTASIAKAKAPAAVRGLALLVLVFGLLLAAGEAFRDPDASSAGRDTRNEESAGSAPAEDATHVPEDAMTADADTMMQVEQPTWYSFVIPFLGFAGVMVGGTIRSRAAAA